MSTYRELLNTTVHRLIEAKCTEPESDAYILMEHFLGMTRTGLFISGGDDVKDADSLAQYNKAVEERCTGKPVQYITGVQEFCGLPFKVAEHTLIPRFDTEILVEHCGKYAEGKTVLDMCSGTGCIGIALNKLYKSGPTVGCDIVPGAVELAKQNAESLNADSLFYLGDLFEALKGSEYENCRFDIIVSNPPYIETKVIESLDREVREFEPMSALDGSEDGLLFYRRIVKESVSYLKKDGMLFFEIGYNQAEAVTKLMADNGFEDIVIVKDYAGLDRVVYGVMKKEF